MTALPDLVPEDTSDGHSRSVRQRVGHRHADLDELLDTAVEELVHPDHLPAVGNRSLRDTHRTSTSAPSGTAWSIQRVS